MNPLHDTYDPESPQHHRGTRHQAVTLSRAAISSHRARVRDGRRRGARFVIDEGAGVTSYQHARPAAIDGCTGAYPCFGPAEARRRPLPITATQMDARWHRRVNQLRAEVRTREGMTGSKRGG